MIVALFFLVVATFVIAKLWQRKKLYENLPPGPPGLPIVGNLRQLDPEDPRKTYLQWHKQYGPLFTVWMGRKPFVFVTSFDLMQDLFVKRGDEFAERPSAFLFDVFTQGKYGIVNIDGEIWREQRRFSLHVLRNFGFGRKVMEEKIGVEVGFFLTAIEKRMKGANSAKMNVKPMLEVCISNIITSLLMSKTYSYDDDPIFIKLKQGMDKIVNFFNTYLGILLDSFPFLQYVPLFNHFGMDEIVPEVELYFDTIRSQVEEIKRDVNLDEEPLDFAVAYLKEMDRRRTAGEDMGFFSDQQLYAVILDLWSAGMETTVTTLYWSMILMMYHPEVQKKAQEEIDDIVGSERFPNMADRPAMPYNAAVILELQRYGNVIITNVPHTVKEDTDIQGYTIKKGVIIMPQISVLHYDETIFEEPMKFRPERFLDADGKLNKLSEKLMPFSLGKRICLGEGLARMELFIINTALLQKFSFAFAEDEPKPTLKPEIGFSAFPKTYNVCITKRNN